MTAAAILVLATLPDHASAGRLADVLVRERLAACVSIGAPIESIYHWRGKVETAKEVPVTIKTRGDCYAAVEKAIRHQHAYELPEIIAIPIIDGFLPYLAWIADAAAPPA
ncbi:MAG: divalent-cation tolerance protein CutA [Betaproteobacteria bacterium]